MTELTRQLNARYANAVERLSDANANDDDYLIDITLAEIESLRRTAEENGLTLPGAEPEGVATSA